MLMQPEDSDNLEYRNNKTNYIIPDQSQDSQPSVIPPQPNMPPPKRAKKIVPIVIITLVVLVSVAVAAYFLLINNESTTLEQPEAVSQQTAISTMPSDSELPLEPSIFDYFGIDEDVVSAQYTVRPLSEAVIFAMQGDIVRDSQGKFTTRQHIDVDYVQSKLDEFNNEQEWFGFGETSELSAHDQFQIDMLGFMSNLGLVNYTNKELVAHDMGELDATCIAAIELSNEQASDIVKNLKVDFIPISDVISEWDVDLTETKEHYISSVNQISEACYGGSRNITDERRSIMKQGLYIAKETTSADSLKVTIRYDGGLFSSPYVEEVAEILLSDIKKGERNNEAYEGPSLFDINNANSFVLMIDTCRDFPVIATRFAASFSYTKPEQDYYGPSVFDGIYYCTEQEAQDAGYSLSRF